MKDTQSSTHPMIVTLIHGTFASGAHWVSDDAPLARDLPALLARPVAVRTFGWDGGNSYRARQRAAQALDTSLAVVEREAPGVPHFLIAHSHAGNVALQTLQSEAARKPVYGLICLNTPFLHCRRRPLFPLLLCLEAIQPIALCVWLGLAMFVFRYRDLYPDERLRPLFFAALWAWGAAPVGFLLNRPYRQVKNVFTEWLEETQERRWRAFSTGDQPPVPLLSLTVKRDEAYWWLRTIDLLSLGVKLPMYGSLAFLVVAWLANQIPDLFRLIGLVYAPAWDLGDRIEAASIAGIMGAIALYLASLVLLLVVMPLVRGHVLSYGERPLDSLLLDIRVKPVASQGAPSEVIELRGRRWLRHSALYTDPNVIQRIAKWIQESLRDRDRAHRENSVLVE